MMSARRFSGELREVFGAGYISRLPAFNTVLDTFDRADVTLILTRMIEASAAPLREVEDTFAVDASGFSSSRFSRWYSEKYGTTKPMADWVKAHIAVGTKTNVVAAVEVLGQRSGDSPQLPALVNTTARTFTIKEVSADKAYAGTPNFEAVEALGGTFYPAFKVGTTGAVGGSFAKAFHTFCLNREEYLRHYHQRSNVETAFSMVKRKFGDSVRSKTDTAMRNEVLAKFVCHNLCVLIAEMYTLGIEAVFTATVTCTRMEPVARELRVFKPA